MTDLIESGVDLTYAEARELTDKIRAGLRRAAPLLAIEFRQQQRRRVSSVYFIQPIGGGPIKIGVGEDVGRRIADIQRMSPFPLRLLAVVPDAGFSLEHSLHHEFAASRLHGEWFEPTPGLMARIASYIAEAA